MATVLIVEDEESLADPLAFLLRKEGFDTLTATDGPSALSTFQSEHVDIVLLDLMLPGMSGTEVCKKIRTTSQVPIIMVTARDSEIDKVLGLELGADDYVTGPYCAAGLMLVLANRQPRGRLKTSWKVDACAWTSTATLFMSTVKLCRCP